jgi:hypothetical protein
MTKQTNDSLTNMDPTHAALISTSLAPHAGAIKSAVDSAGEIAKEILRPAVKVLSALCAPAEQIGFLAADSFTILRAKNIAKFAQHVEHLLDVSEDGTLRLKAHPRMLLGTIAEASLCDEDELQKMWAGLLASSLTPEGKAHSNSIFIDILKNLSNGEARLIRLVCVQCKKGLINNDEVRPYGLGLTYENTREVLGCSDMSEVRAYLEHLRALGLLAGAGMVFLEVGLKIDGKEVVAPNLTPSAFALQLYVRCQGFKESIKQYFKVTEVYDVSRDVSEEKEVFVMPRHKENKTAP